MNKHVWGICFGKPQTSLKINFHFHEENVLSVHAFCILFTFECKTNWMCPNLSVQFEKQGFFYHFEYNHEISFILDVNVGGSIALMFDCLCLLH